MKMKIETVSHRMGLMQDLKDPEFATEYIKACLNEGGQNSFLKALRNVAEAWGGPSRVAKDTHLNRSGVYKMLADNGNPSFSSILTLLGYFGLKISVEPISHPVKRAAGRSRTSRETAKAVHYAIKF